MADGVNTAGPPTEFPVPPHFPTVYADGIMNAAPTPSVVKFYLARFDPSFTDINKYQTQPIAQIVMPIDGFIHAAAFFESAVARLVALNLVTQERVDQLRRTILS